MNRRALFLVLLFITLALLAAGCTANPQKKPQDQADTKTYSTLYAEAVDNPHENGCVSCHKKTEEVDRSLQAYVQRIEGHPDVKEGTISGCYYCHEAEKNYNLYKRFYKGIHKSHWLSETYYKKSNGRCSSCHTIEKNGVSGIKDYPLAGYRNLAGKTTQPKAKEAPKPAKEQPEEKQEKQQPEGEGAEEQPEGEQEQQPTPGP